MREDCVEDAVPLKDEKYKEFADAFAPPKKYSEEKVVGEVVSEYDPVHLVEEYLSE